MYFQSQARSVSQLFLFSQVGVLELERGRRREAWDTFMQQQFEKSALVDKEMDEGMKKLTDKYAELEKKLELEYLLS
ncbi:hypothetical protein DPMN_061242 [Dreissena polymorpha]|uniref:Biogenesis of lysosome-related organelles complex 1 subunit 5 n=1 Tax=Dreissena polymorpha TaxID=45954 RepID=A0A9D4C7H4_DREPO|nr:hypothetical protein DPMN_061242 [Dreissena polymorpha]